MFAVEVFWAGFQRWWLAAVCSCTARGLPLNLQSARSLTTVRAFRLANEALHGGAAFAAHQHSLCDVQNLPLWTQAHASQRQLF